jgi:hypothetical protein
MLMVTVQQEPYMPEYLFDTLNRMALSRRQTFPIQKLVLLLHAVLAAVSGSEDQLAKSKAAKRSRNFAPDHHGIVSKPHFY